MEHRKILPIYDGTYLLIYSLLFQFEYLILVTIRIVRWCQFVLFTKSYPTARTYQFCQVSIKFIVWKTYHQERWGMTIGLLFDVNVQNFGSDCCIVRIHFPKVSVLKNQQVFRVFLFYFVVFLHYYNFYSFFSICYALCI